MTLFFSLPGFVAVIFSELAGQTCPCCFSSVPTLVHTLTLQLFRARRGNGEGAGWVGVGSGSSSLGVE